MIAMLDRDCTGKMGFNEFKELLAVINAWKQNFINIDHDRSGTVEHHELNQAIAAMGYRLSPQTLTAIVKRYSKNGRIFFDDYVACCVKLRALTAFSLETCRIMIAMLDRDCTGKMGFNEFKELLAVINAWKQNFINIDHDRSGTVEHHELNQAIAAMGYRLSPQTLTAIVKRYSKNGRIFFDDYVACCVKLRALTDFFRRRDHLQQGMVNFSYDDFLQGTMTI